MWKAPDERASSSESARSSSSQAPNSALNLHSGFMFAGHEMFLATPRKAWKPLPWPEELPQVKLMAKFEFVGYLGGDLLTRTVDGKATAVFGSTPAKL